MGLDYDGAAIPVFPIEMPNGLVGKPSLTWVLDKDSGLYRSGANRYHLVAGGFVILTITSTGVIAEDIFSCLSAFKKASTTITMATVILDTGADIYLCNDMMMGGFQVDLPLAANNTGRVLTFVKTDANPMAITVAGNGFETINGAAQNAEMDTQYDTLSITSDGTNWFIVAARIA